MNYNTTGIKKKSSELGFVKIVGKNSAYSNTKSNIYILKRSDIIGEFSNIEKIPNIRTQNPFTLEFFPTFPSDSIGNIIGIQS